MSWLGGSLTSITGQLSNLTKDILTEGTQEVSDHATELRIAQEKNAECLNTISTLKTENERLKRFNHELEEKAESAELQINTISREYRQMLEEKEREINKLKHSHEELVQQHRATLIHQDSHGGMSSPTSPKDGHPHGFDQGQFSNDGLDFGDSISMQHEINRLMSEVKRLKAENKHWRSTNGVAKEGKTPEVENHHVALQDTIQELKEQLRHEKEHHQQETVLLQDMHSQKITALHKKFKAEISQYKEKVQELEQRGGHDGNVAELEAKLGELQRDHDALLSDKSQTDSLIQTFKQQLQEKEKELTLLKLENEKVSTQLHNAKYQLLDQLDANHAQSIDLMCDLQEMRRNISQNAIARKNALLKERQELVDLMIESGLQQKEINTSVEILEAEREQVALESEHMLSEMGNTEHQALTKDIVDSIEKENLVLKKKNLELQEQIAVLEKTVKTLSEQRGRKDEEEKVDEDEEYDWNTAEISELSNRNSELERQLEELSSNHERELEEFESLKTDWVSEKEALEDSLFELRQKLKEKGTAENANDAQKEKLEKELSALKSDLDSGDRNGALLRELEEQKSLVTNLQEEKEGLETSLEELDSQNEEAMAQVIKIRNELQKRLAESEKECEEKNSLIKELEKTVNRLQKEAQQLDDLEEEVFNLRESKEQLETQLKSLSSKGKGEQSSKGCEKCTELRQQQEKAAMTVNELHMDVKELEQKLQKNQEEVKDKVSKLKQARESNQELQKVVQDLTDKYQTKEEEVQRLREEIGQTSRVETETLQQQVDEKSEEMKSVVAELEEVNSHLAEYMERYTKLQMEISELVCKLSERDNQVRENREALNQLKEENHELSEKLKESSTKVEELQESVNQLEKNGSDLSTKLIESEKKVQDFKDDFIQKESERQRLNTQIEALREEKNNLQREFDQLEGVLQQKTKHNENYIQELKKGQESDSSSVESERKRLLEDVHEKDMNMLKLEEKIKSLQSQLSETKETLQSAIDGQQGVADILEENERTIKELKEENSQLSQENDSLQMAVKEQKEQLLRMAVVEEELVALKEEKNTLKEELRMSKQTLENKVEKEALQAQTLEVITDLESELNMSTEKIVSLEKELKQLKEKVSEQETEIQELNEKNSGYLKSMGKESDSSSQLQSLVEKRDKRISVLEGELNELRETISTQEKGIQELNEKNLSHLKESEEKNKKLHQLETTLVVLEESVAEKEEAILRFQRRLMRAESLVEPDKEHLLTDELSYLAIEEKPRVENQEEVEVKDKDSQEETSPSEHQPSEVEDLAKENERLLSENQELKEKFEEDLNSYSERLIQLEEENEKLKQDLSEQRDEYVKTCKLNEEEVELCKRTQSTVEDQAMEISSLKYQLSQSSQQDLDGENTKDLINGSEKMQEDIIKPEISLSLSTGKQSNIVVEGEELEKLKSLLEEKDSVISELQTNNSSLLKMLETKSVNSLGDKTLVDVHRLENEVKQLKLEKEQILAVMNEKSRETSNLKSEVHRLTNIVSAEKVALAKLQKDNHDLTQNKEKSVVEDMQKEALQNLSRIIRDKDMEIEALTSKNETLVAVMQESSDSGSQINSLMQDKTNLSKQLADLKSEREQMITYLNQKHQESLAYHAEIQRLTEYINTEAEKNQTIQQNYAALVPQYEEKNENLLKAQNELINYKHKFQDLEIKYGELDQRMNASETVDILTHNLKLEEIKSLQEKQKELLDSIKEKEMKLQALHQQNSEYEESLSRQAGEISSLKKQLDNMAFKLQGLQSELTDEGSEKTGLEQQVVEQMSNIQVLKESNNRLTLALQEKEFEVNSLHEKVQTLQAVIQNKEGEKGQVNKMMQENEAILAQAKQLQQERDQAMMALKQRQSEQAGLLQEIQKLKEKDSKSQKELERLRGHLIQMEDGYTQEALAAEEREKDLRNRLAVAEERVISSSSMMESASQQASQQSESLQQQLHMLAGQRDQAYLQVAALQEQCQQYAVSLNNLQLVLEQFQQEKDAQLSLEMEQNQNEIAKLRKQVNSLQTELNTTKEKLMDAEEGLEAASRLTEQLDRKEEALLALKEEVQIREKSLQAAEDEIHRLRKSTDNKVDKVVIKNILMGYFLSPKNKQPEVLRAVGGILNFTDEDFDKISGASKSWVSGLWRFGGSPNHASPSTPTKAVPGQLPSTPKAESSFSELFVKFLETESTPTPPVMKLPAEDMARDVQRQKQAYKDSYNPFTAPRHVSMPAASSVSDHRNSPILMSGSPTSTPMTLFAPSVTPQPRSENERTTSQNTSSAILKNVLETR